jgi:phosphomannomutase
MSLSINSSILREYDIRGIVDQTLTIQDAFLVGWSFAKLVGDYYVNVGCDGRLSSPKLTEALISGLIEGGAKPRFIGKGPTPMLYFSTFSKENEAVAGIMVTGSHNPPTHNGFKFIYKGRPFFGDEIKNLKNISNSYTGNFSKHSNYESVDFSELYIERLLEDCKLSSELKVAWDPGNGAAGEIVEKLVKKLSGTHIVVNEKIDGTFPAHHPDPTVKENLEQLISIVLDQKCDLGVAFDGDGDRIGVIDSKGRIIWGDQLLLLFAREVLDHIPNSVIIADVKASQKLFEGIKNYGGKPLMWKTGHSLIKTKMHEQNSPLAGEMSGHIFFADRYYGFDDAIYAALRLINIVSSGKQSLSEMIDSFPVVFNTPEIRIDCDDQKKFSVINEVKRLLDKQNKKYNDIDGIRYNCDEGWWLLRASNTQAVLVVRCEADSEHNLQILCRDISTILSIYDLDVTALK